MRIKKIASQSESFVADSLKPPTIQDWVDNVFYTAGGIIYLFIAGSFIERITG